MRNSTVGLVAAICMSFGAGGIVGIEGSQEVRPTELTTARTLTRQNVRLIGFDCGDHRTVALAEYEDEMPICREIRRLDGEEDFL